MDASSNITGADRGKLQTRTGTGTFRIEFTSGDIVTATFERTDDRPERAFGLPGGIVVRPGTYVYQQGTLAYQLATQRKVTGTFTRDDRWLLRRRADHGQLQRPGRAHQAARG